MSQTKQLCTASPLRWHMLQSSCQPLLTARGLHAVPCLVPGRCCARAGRRGYCNAQPAGFGPAVPFSGMRLHGTHHLVTQYFLGMKCSAGGSTSTLVLPHKPDLQGKDVRANWNAVALAFLGDSVWEVCSGGIFTCNISLPLWCALCMSICICSCMPDDASSLPQKELHNTMTRSLLKSEQKHRCLPPHTPLLSSRQARVALSRLEYLLQCA